MRSHTTILKLITLATILCGGARCFAADAPVLVTTNTLARPANWAVSLSRPGVPNLYQVTPNLFRGAQPTAQGMAELKALGVKTVFNLRGFHSDDEEARGTGLKLNRARMEPWHAEEEDVVEFLKVAANTNNLPLFVHCQRGADRTGMVCAMYRVVVCGWTKADAISEMKDGGFGFNPTWQNIIHFIEHADVDEISRRAGIKSAVR
jgi:protein tyrosine phosphatase (PTP) superfamily phosphohydrolase (DUF442 family)